MARGEGETRRRAGGKPDHGRARDAEPVEQGGIGVGLHRDGGVRRQRRAEISEARGRDQPYAGHAGDGTGEIEPLIEAATRAMHDEQWRAFAGLGIFDRAECGVDAAAAAGNARAVICQIARAQQSDAGGECGENGETDPAHAAGHASIGDA